MPPPSLCRTAPSPHRPSGIETGPGRPLPNSPLISATHGCDQPDCSKQMQQHPSRKNLWNFGAMLNWEAVEFEPSPVGDTLSPSGERVGPQRLPGHLDMRPDSHCKSLVGEDPSRTQEDSPQSQLEESHKMTDNSQVHHVQISSLQHALQTIIPPLHSRPTPSHTSTHAIPPKTPTSKVHLQAPHTPSPSHKNGIAFPPRTCPPQTSTPLPPHQPPTLTPPSLPTNRQLSTPISTRQPPLPSRSSGFRQATRSRRGRM